MPRATVALRSPLWPPGCGGTDTSGDDTFAYDEDAPLALEAGARRRARRSARRPGGLLRERRRSRRGLSRRRRLGATAASRQSSTSTARAASAPAPPPRRVARGPRRRRADPHAPLRERDPAGRAHTEETLRWQRDTIVADVVAVRRAFDMLAADERVDAGSARPRRLELRGQARRDRRGRRRPGRRRGADVGRARRPCRSTSRRRPPTSATTWRDVLTPDRSAHADREREGRRSSCRPAAPTRSCPNARCARSRTPHPRARASGGTTPSTTWTTARGASSSTGSRSGSGSTGRRGRSGDRAVEAWRNTHCARGQFREPS